jgi:hypothetical protein
MKMEKILSYDDLAALKLNKTLPESVISMIQADVTIFVNELNTGYGKDFVAKYGPMVLVMDDTEYGHLNEEFPIIDLGCLEYSDVVHVSDKESITKSLFLTSNGDAGFIMYVISDKKPEPLLFNNQKYVTSNLENHIPIKVQRLLFDMIEIARRKPGNQLDYLQVFEIQNKNVDGKSVLQIQHRQEVPEYVKDYVIDKTECINAKIFVISEQDEKGDEYCVMMMAEDY